MLNNLSNDREERLDFYDTNYTTLVEYILDKKIYLGDKKNRKCRFCGKEKKDTTFKNQAHALPELIGNKYIFSYYECDVCNKKFSETIEDHFGKFLGLYRTFSKIDGKKGIPSYKHIDKTSRIDVDKVGIKIYSNKNSICSITKDKNELLIKGIKQPYIPENVFKCLVKIALTILPDNGISDFLDTISWIAGNMKYESNTLNCFFAYTPAPFINIWTLLLKRRNDNIELPFSIFILAFSNYFFQIFVPVTKKDIHIINKVITLPIFPCFPSPYENEHIKMAYKIINFSGKDIVKNEDISLILRTKDKIEFNC